MGQGRVPALKTRALRHQGSVRRRVPILPLSPASPTATMVRVAPFGADTPRGKNAPTAAAERELVDTAALAPLAPRSSLPAGVGDPPGFSIWQFLKDGAGA